ncbi:MAG: chain-length determining protein [Prevotella sp.]|nr:chain-length determining protein [Prevotella sp.]
MEEQKKSSAQERPTINLGNIWQAIKKYRRHYYTVIPLTIVVVYLISLGYPDYYKCKVSLVPETHSSSSLGALGALANTFGVNLGGSVNKETDAITPSLYPDLMKSLDFTTSLFEVKVKRDRDDKVMTYYEYLRDYQRDPLWHDLTGKFLRLILGSEKKEMEPVDLFRLKPEQRLIVGRIIRNVSCEIDKKMNVITIDVTDQDPLVAATVADSVRERLQEALTAYRTAKSRHDLAYVKKIQKEAKRDYDRACMLYADFMDSNRDIVLESVRQQRLKLENDMQLRYNNYNALSAQLLAAQAKVQQDTPAFTTLERATVPGGKTGPNRKLIVTLCTVLAFIILTLWIIYKEGEFKPMFRGLN